MIVHTYLLKYAAHIVSSSDSTGDTTCNKETYENILHNKPFSQKNHCLHHAGFAAAKPISNIVGRISEATLC